MADNNFASLGGGGSYGPRRPDAQGYQGPQGPTQSSFMQGFQGGRGAPGAPGAPAQQQPSYAQPGQSPLSTPAPGSSTPSSPVASNGSIPQQGTQPPITFMGPGQAQAPQGGSFFQGGGGANFYAPQAPQAAPQPPPYQPAPQGQFQQGANQGPLPQGQGTNPWGPWVNRPATADLGNTPFSGYQAGTISQFQAPTLQGQAQVNALMQSIMANPDVISPQVLAQMQGQNQDQAAQMLQQGLVRNADATAARGFLPGASGIQQGLDRRATEAAQGQILGGNRDLAVKAAQANQGARVAAAGLGNDYLTSQAGRASSLYTTGLAGQQAQEGAYQNAAASQQQAQQMALQRALAQAGLTQDAYNSDLNAYFQGRGQDIQSNLGQGGLALDQRRLNETARQFDLGNNLNWASLLNNMTMDRAGYGLNLAQLQQQAQNNLFGRLFGG